MSRQTPMMTVRRRLQGVVFLLVPALLIALSVAIYNKRFIPVESVLLKTSTAGYEMHPGADVKVHGVVVGEVRSLQAHGDSVTLKLALNPGQAKKIPADVRAQLLPTTIFGSRYVALIPPPGAGLINPAAAGAHPQPLRDGSVIEQDRTANSIELSELYKNTLRLLTAVKPADLSATLNAFAQALNGRGEQLGKNLVRLNEFLKRFNPHLPELTRNLEELVKFSANYSEAVPDILQGLTDLTVTSRTIADQRRNLEDVYRTATHAVVDLDDFLRRNADNLIELTARSRSTLELLARYAPEFPCLFRSMVELIPRMDKALGKGTDRPGIRANLRTVQHKGRYQPGKDKPRFGTDTGPRCYPVPYTPGGNRPPITTEPGMPVPVAIPLGGLGMPNSAGENQLISELVAPSVPEVPTAMPDWTSVLLGPLYRGARVDVQAPAGGGR